MQIAHVLKPAETGTPVAELICRTGVSQHGFYRWKKTYGELGVGELRHVRQFEEENRKLKQEAVDLSLDKHILQDIPATLLYVLLCSEGGLANHKRLYWLYREDGLNLRLKRPRRHVSAASRERQPPVAAPSQLRSMAFLPCGRYLRPVWNDLFDGRRLRAFTVVAVYVREALAIDVDRGIKCEQAVVAMMWGAALRGASKAIRVDNGPECVSKAPDRWAQENGVPLEILRPGKPTDNAFVEPFNGRVCNDSLMRTGFCHRPTRASRSKLGACTIIRAARPRLSAGRRRTNMLLPLAFGPQNQHPMLTFSLEETPGARVCFLESRHLSDIQVEKIARSVPSRYKAVRTPVR